MSRIEVLKIKNTSQSARKGYGPWVDWEEEMWRKTVLKRAMKYVPQSEDMMRALDLDDEDSDPQISKPQEGRAVSGRGVDALRSAVGVKQEAEVVDTTPAPDVDAEEAPALPDDLSDDGDFDA